MPAARYYLALYLLMFFPGGMLYWFSVHPFIGFWRRIGLHAALAVNGALIALVAAAVYLARRPLLSVEYGDHPPLAILRQET